jgi:hypothetical protein
VFSADLEAIDVNNIELDNLEYCIDEFYFYWLIVNKLHSKKT